MNKKRFLFLLLSLCLILTQLAACGEKTDDKKTADEEATTTVSDVTTETDPYANYNSVEIEAKDYEKYEFKFLISYINNQDWTEWEERDIFAEAMTGEPVNDAVFKRNVMIEEKFNIKISEKKDTNFDATLKKTVQAGDNAFDVASQQTFNSAVNARAGMFIDLYKVPNLNLDKPWWNQKSIESLSIAGALPLAQSDLIIIDNDATSAMIFNKNLQKEYSIEDLYTCVREGKWTLDKLIELSKAVSKDLNGDDKMYIKDDLIGCITQGDSMFAFLFGGGAAFARKNDEDFPYMDFQNERTYQIFDKITELMTNWQYSVNLHFFEGKFPIYDEQVKMFSEDRAMFSWIRMRIVERLRAMETDFGILPVPKFDEKQEHYINQINTYTANCIAVPKTAPDLDRTGRVLESMTSLSADLLTPAYYDITLNGKLVRDNESLEMLDIIFSNTYFDIGEIYNIGGFPAAFHPMMRKEKFDGITSLYEKYESKFEKDLEKLYEQFEKVKEGS